MLCVNLACRSGTQLIDYINEIDSVSLDWFKLADS